MPKEYKKKRKGATKKKKRKEKTFEIMRILLGSTRDVPSFLSDVFFGCEEGARKQERRKTIRMDKQGIEC